jgi:hypothetical protein
MKISDWSVGTIGNDESAFLPGWLGTVEVILCLGAIGWKGLCL